MTRTLSDSLAVTAGTWVVLSRSEDLDPGGRCARWLDLHVAPAGRWSGSGVRVWHVKREDVAVAGATPDAGTNRR
jgi:hypothetical protein